MKQSLGGCERFHGAVIAHDGTEESRVFKETAALGEELDRIGRRIMGSRIESRVAIMFDLKAVSARPPASTIPMRFIASTVRCGVAMCRWI